MGSGKPENYLKMNQSTYGRSHISVSHSHQNENREERHTKKMESNVTSDSYFKNVA